jgi:multidrug efflux pump subunit AcrA (membrane-fusion protein)
MVCRAKISKEHVNGYIISSGCVQTQRNGHSVWVLRNGRTERVMIQIGDFVENGVLVTEGLTAGDTVISKGYQKMFQGARVSF